MGYRSTNKKKAAMAAQSAQKRHKKRFIACMAALATGVMVTTLAPSLFPTLMNTSILTGIGWVRELLCGHPVRF